MRILFLVTALAACDPDVGDVPKPNISLRTAGTYTCSDDALPADGEVVPYRDGGKIDVAIRLDDPRLAGGTHATAEIVTSELVEGATLSGTVTLDEDVDGTLGGTIALAWPTDRMFTYAVEVAGTREVKKGCMEAATFTLDLAGPSAAPASSIVALEVTTTRNGQPAGTAVTFEATPTVTFVPAAVKTGADGKATVHFAKPETGPVLVRARLGGGPTKEKQID